MARKLCSQEGCNNLAASKGWQNGHVRYDKKCQTHRRLDAKTNKKLIKNDFCENCGWDKAPCDRHRLIKEQGYIKENVLILCPNCHRLIHFRPDLIDIDKILLSKQIKV